MSFDFLITLLIGALVSVITIIIITIDNKEE